MDDYRIVQPQFYGPHMQPIDRTPSEPIEVPAPSWPFGEANLRQLLDEARRAGNARRDAAEQVRDARGRLQNLRSRVQADEAQFGAAPEATYRAKAVVEAEVARLVEAQAALDEKANSVIAVAASCESWAREVHHWTPDGLPGGVSLPPAPVGV
jgi:hypothetical protein